MTTNHTLTAVIVDDERKSLEALQRLLTTQHPEILIQTTCDSVASAFGTLSTSTPDVVFMDIMLPDGTAFDLLAQLPSVKFKIIFTTGHDEFALRAIKLAALDYLLKPIDTDELRQAIARLRESKHDHENHERQLRLLQYHVTSSGTDSAKIALPTLDGFSFVPISDIIKCVAQGNYTDIFLTNRNKLTACKILKEFEELFAPFDFARIHNSYIINLQHLKRYVKGKGGYVVLSDGSELEVSVRRKEEFLRRIGM